MQEEKDSLKGLLKKIEEAEEEENLCKQDFEENPNRGNERRYYFSGIEARKLLIQKAKIILGDCYQKLNFSLRNLFGYSISKFKGYGKLMTQTQEEIEKLSKELNYFNQKYVACFDKKKMTTNSKV